MQLQERGIAAPSYTTLHGQYCLRIAKQSSQPTDDFDALAKEVVRLGRELIAQFPLIGSFIGQLSK